MADIKPSGITKTVYVPALSSTPPADVEAAIGRFLSEPDPLRETIRKILIEHEAGPDGFWQCSCDEISGDRVEHLADVIWELVEDAWCE